MPAVSVRCVPDYDNPDALYTAVDAHFEALGVAEELTPETRVLLKPNLLAGRAPESAVTTHPALLRAVAQWLRNHGVTKIVLADSPGGIYTPGSLRRVYAACGLNDLSDVLTLNENTVCGERDGFTLLQPVLEADYIINCCKLKTHGLTVMTGAVKNLFGCLPGLKKPEIHCVKSTIESFSDFLLSLAQTVRPQISLMDAIDCMEGNGPGGGTVRHMGYTLASRSPLALDHVAATLMGYPSSFSPVLHRAARQNLYVPEDIALVGDELTAANPPFTLPDAVVKKEAFFSPNHFFHHFCGRRQTYPVVLKSKCVGCGRCAESCPKHLITVENGKANMVRKGCISCFCCQEMCPVHAIDVCSSRGWKGFLIRDQRKSK